MNELEIKEHPTLHVNCRSDGAIEVLRQGARYTRKTRWSFGRKRGNYLSVCINKKDYSVHRLIAEAFIDNPSNKPTVDHINRDKYDNRVENLRWADKYEQMSNQDRVDASISTYGVRYCDDPSLYCHKYHELNGDKIRARKRELYHQKKQVA